MEKVKVTPYAGPLFGLPTDDNHFVYEWLNPYGKFLISVSQVGFSTSCHYAAEKPVRKYSEQALNDCVDFVFETFDWCERIFANVKNPNVAKTILKCGFNFAFDYEDCEVYIRRRNGRNIRGQQKGQES